MFRSFGLPELAVILVIVLLLFGATRLPQVGHSLGASMRAFKRAIGGEDVSEEENGTNNDKAAEKDKESEGVSSH